MTAKRPREDPEATSLVCTLRHLFARMVSPKALLWCSGQTGGSKNLLGKPRPGSYPPWRGARLCGYNRLLCKRKGNEILESL